MLKITLGRGENKRIKGGHPWIFSNEIKEISGDKTAGSATELFDAGGSFLGTGYYNPHSLIAVRLLSTQRVDIDSPDFYRDRIQKALQYRQMLYPDMQSFRAVFGEADFLPGLVVDKYGEYLS